MSRWVCMRCYESNDEAAPSCAKCGLLRGATPVQGEEWTAPTAQPATGGGGMSTVLGLLARFWWVLAIVAVGIGGLIFNAQRDEGGQITQSGSMSVYDLRVGDCFDIDREEELTDDVTARPCSESHQFELFFVGDMRDGAFPTDDEFLAFLQDACVPAFGQYIGAPYETSRYDIFSFEPTADGWDSGDHAIMCAAFDPMEDELTSAVKDSAR